MPPPWAHLARQEEAESPSVPAASPRLHRAAALLLPLPLPEPRVKCAVLGDALVCEGALGVWGWGEAREASLHPGRVLEQSPPAASTGVTAAVLLPSVGELQEGSGHRRRSLTTLQGWLPACVNGEELWEGIKQGTK